MIYQGKARYPVEEVVMHCAAINTGQFNGLTPFQVWSTINRWHKQRGFVNGFGYHGLIMPSGHYVAGRPWSMIGSHVLDHNRGKLGFLLIEKRRIVVPSGFPGGEEAWLAANRFLDFYTPEQEATLRALIASVPNLRRVTGHNDYAPRLCPGFKVRSLDWLPQSIRSPAPVGEAVQ